MAAKFAVSNLKLRPDKIPETLALIENAFEYKNEFHFDIDFVSLFNKDNFHLCFILIDTENDKVVAHLGTKLKHFPLAELQIPVLLLGGISVHGNYRGQGLFKLLFDHIYKQFHSLTAFFILWSNKVDMYNKFNFHLCGEIFEIEKSLEVPTDYFFMTKFHLLSREDQNKIKELYLTKILSQNFTFIRNDHDWRNIAATTSADILIAKDFSDYAFINKGQDLVGIIHETTCNSQTSLSELSHWGKIWLNHKNFGFDQHQFCCLVKIVPNLYFYHVKDNLLAKDYEISDEQQTLFDLFGPNKISNSQNLYISGMDSI